MGFRVWVLARRVFLVEASPNKNHCIWAPRDLLSYGYAQQLRGVINYYSAICLLIIVVVCLFLLFFWLLA